MDTHALIRTSPKGQPFIGKCAKCGIDGLTIAQASKECVNPAGLTSGEGLAAVLHILDTQDQTNEPG